MDLADHLIFFLGGDFHINGKCLIHGKFSCGSGIQFLVGAKANAEFGNNFEANANCIINTGNKELFVGDDVIFGWGDDHSCCKWS